MHLERPDTINSILFKNCIIKPLDDLEGLIIAVKYGKCETEILARYFLHGLAHYNWFFDFDIEFKKNKMREIAQEY